MASRSDSGRKGGLTTRARYSTEQRRAWGRMGGRPRDKPSYIEIRQRQLLERNGHNNEKEAAGPLGNNLSELRKLQRLQSRSSSTPEIQEAGTGQETPRGESLPERTAV